MRELPTTKTRAQSKFIREMASMGMGPEDDDFWEAWDEEGLNSGKVATKANTVLGAELRLGEASLVLASIHNPQAKPYEHSCKQCKRKFLTTYFYDRYCSDNCRADSLAAVGIVWDPNKSQQERWQGVPPAKISPDTLVTLKKWARQILEYEPVTPVPEPPVIVVQSSSSGMVDFSF